MTIKIREADEKITDLVEFLITIINFYAKIKAINHGQVLDALGNLFAIILIETDGLSIEDRYKDIDALNHFLKEYVSGNIKIIKK